MNYKETFFFIAKCLTISLEEKNRDEIELLLKTTDVDWDNIVKVSTSHYAFPAIYCNFKRADFLKYLPSDLVEYLYEITEINRERNVSILKQVLSIIVILKEIKVIPEVGPSYYLVPADGNAWIREDRSQVLVPSWVLFKW